MKMRFLAAFLGRTSGAETGTESPSGRHRASTGRRVRPSAGFGVLAAAAALVAGPAVTSAAAAPAETNDALLDGTPRAALIVALHSGKCLDVTGGSTANGAQVIQWTCHGGANQRWTALYAGGGYYYLRAQHSGKCADVAGGSTANGAKVIQWTCHGGANQQWRIVRQAAGGYSAVARHSGKCADVTGGSTANGAHVIQWRCHGGANQRWYLR